MLNDDPSLNKSALLERMMDLARQKLVFHNRIDQPSLHKDIARTAVLDVLITIEYDPRWQPANDFQKEMVASHMRTAFSVPYHRSYVFSGYPSEPFIAEAALRQMFLYNTVIQGNWSIAGILQNNVQGGLIDLGQKGEVVMRLLLRKAYMDTIIAEQGPKKTNFSKGCNFLQFLKALFAEGFYSLILECQPENNVVSPGKLADAFEHAVVRFTHFAKAADESAMTTRGMAMSFLRGAAIIGCTNQKMVDIAIPILLNSSDRIQEASMSAFLIQVKW